MHDVLVLGAGLSGLSAARRLSVLLSNVRSTSIALVESNPRRLGGWVDSHTHQLDFLDGSGVRRKGEVVCESGPRTVRPIGGKGGAMRMLRLVKELELTDSLIKTFKTDPAAQNRFILDPQTHQLSRVSINPFSSPLARTLILSILLEPLRRRTASPTASDHTADESVSSFLTRRFGPSLLPLISAFIHGIYAADAGKLSASAAFQDLVNLEKEYGSVVLGLLRGGLKESKEEMAREKEGWAELGEMGKEREKWSTWSLKGGLGILTRSMEMDLRKRGVDIGLGMTVERIEPVEDGVEVHVSSSSKPRATIRAKHVISSLPPPILNSLTPSLDASHLLSDPRATVGVVNLVYPLPPKSIHPEGFGYLIPNLPLTSSGVNVNPEGALGVVFDSTAGAGSDGLLNGHITRLTVMLGGPYWSTYPSSLTSLEPIPIPSESELTKLAITHLHRVFPILRTCDPILAVPRLNKECIPTYAPGHVERMKKLGELVKKWSKGRVSLIGSGFTGVSVNDCVRSGEENAEALSRGEEVTGLERFQSVKRE